MPPSSASFHYYEDESIAKLNNLVETNRHLVDELNRANNTLGHIVSRTNELETRVQVLQQQLSNYSLALLNGGVDAKPHLKPDVDSFTTYRRRLGRCVVANRSQPNS